MTKLSDKFEPIDIIALVIISGCVISMVLRNDTVFKDVLLTIVGFYFGKHLNKTSEN